MPFFIKDEQKDEHGETLRVLTIEFGGTDLSRKLLEDIQSAVPDMALHSQVLLECSRVKAASEDAITAMGELLQRLAASGAKVLVLASPALAAMCRGTVVEKTARSLIEVTRLEPSELAGRLDSFGKMMDALAAAVVQTLEGYTSSAPRQAQGEQVPSNDLSPDKQLVGAVGFSYPEYKGNMILCFPEKSYLNIVSRIMGQEYGSIVPEIADWSAELANNVSAVARESLSRSGIRVELTLPLKLERQALEDMRAKSTLRTVYPFQWDSMWFVLEVLALPNAD